LLANLDDQIHLPLIFSARFGANAGLEFNDTMNIAANPKDHIGAFRREIPDHKDIIKGELAQNGDWIVANISTNSFWPIVSQKVRWRGVNIWIMPIMKGFYPAVALMVPPGKSRAEYEVLVMRFISMLSWIEEKGFSVEGGGPSGSNLPRPMGREKERGFSICDEFDLSYLPEVTDDDAMLALALMREGRGINHVGYAFLSFYKILETAFPSGTKRIAWIASSIAGLSGYGVKDALDGIKVQGITTPDDIGTHLFKSGRCAMAHGARKPIIDPDKPGDLRRLGSELPIVRALATKAIEDIFGVETRGTNYRKHLYELAGFKEILGPEIVKGMQDGAPPTEQTMVDIPDISMRIRQKESYAPLEGLRCKHFGHTGKHVHMHFESLQGDVKVDFSLDFENERIMFDVFSGIGVRDTGSAESAERVHEVKRFEQDYFGNGQLHIVATDTGNLIGRKDAYIPMNMYLDGDSAAAELAHWKAVAEQRRERGRKYAEEMERNSRGYDVNLTLGDGSST
jgi:Methylamine utilization protein MauJ